MTNKRELMDYKDLKESTKERLGKFLLDVDQAGLTLTQLRRMSDKEMKKALGIGGRGLKGVKAQRRLINQVQKTKERREKSIDLVVDRYKGMNFRGKRLDSMTKSLQKTAGNVFAIISDDVVHREEFVNEYPNLEIRQRKADLYTKDLLAIKKKDRKNLTNKFDKDLLKDYSP